MTAFVARGCDMMQEVYVSGIGQGAFERDLNRQELQQQVGVAAAST
jgi:hypothetical protein